VLRNFDDNVGVSQDLLEETCSDVWGATKYLPSPPKCEIGGTHCLREFQKYLTHGFRVYTVDFVDFNIKPDRFGLPACYSIISSPGQSFLS